MALTVVCSSPPPATAWAKDDPKLIRVRLHGAAARLRVRPPAALTAARRKCTVPKSASGRMVQWVPRVRSANVRATRAPRTATHTRTLSPGRIVNGIVWAGAGTSSYQALETSAPSGRQSTRCRAARGRGRAGGSPRCPPRRRSRSRCAPGRSRRAGARWRSPREGAPRRGAAHSPTNSCSGSSRSALSGRSSRSSRHARRARRARRTAVRAERRSPIRPGTPRAGERAARPVR